MRRSSRRFHRRSAPGRRRDGGERGADRGTRRVDARRASASRRAAISSDASDRVERREQRSRAHTTATSASRELVVVASSRRAPGAPRAPRQRQLRAGAGSADRSSGVATRRVEERRRATRPVSTLRRSESPAAASLGRAGRILGACPGFRVAPPSSNSSSATSRATRRASSTPTSGPRPAGCDLVAFPELALTGYPPEDLLLRPAFVAQAAEALEKIAARTGRARRGRRVPGGRPRPLQRGGGVCRRPGARRLPQAPAPELRGVRRAALLHRRPPSTARCSSSPACGSASRSARTRGARTGRSSPRPPAAPSSSSTSTRRRTTRAACASARRCSRRGRPTRRCRSST